jgi:hypothetical protein
MDDMRKFNIIEVIIQLGAAIFNFFFVRKKNDLIDGILATC